MRKTGIVIALLTILGISSCGGDGVILFSLEDDKRLGAQFDAEIENDPQYNILSESQYASSYGYLNAMKDEILNSGEVKYKDEFVWELHIIHDDETLNAFATPGGYIYVYTGLIHYLDDASSLAGVMGHEIGHADRRHSSKQMQKNYGLQTLLQVALGNDPGALATIAANLLTLKFSRSDETDADNASVDYLCNTDFETDGAANFFIKIEQSGGSGTPQFLSTHPDPGNRVENIQEKAGEVSCGAESADPLFYNDMTYQDFQNSLPQ